MTLSSAFRDLEGLNAEPKRRVFSRNPSLLKPVIEFTEEQELLYASTESVLKINAYAGSGKTTSLKELATRFSKEKWLYLAFNKDVKNDAAKKFPSNVKVQTTHGLAFADYGVPLQHKIGIKFVWRQIFEQCGVKSPHSNIAYPYSRFLLDVVNNFIASADMEITQAHLVPRGLDGKKRMQLLNGSGHCPSTSRIIADATLIWRAMVNPEKHGIGCPHDAYIKLMQLEQKSLPFDGVLLDECQDSNPALLSIVKAHRGRVVLVGDTHQSIYSFRGAVDAMEAIQVSKEYSLSRSFRFGQEIADFSNLILSYKGTDEHVVGCGEPGVVRGSSSPLKGALPTDVSAMISRSNAELFFSAVRLAERNQKIYIAGGIAAARFDLLRDLYWMKNNLDRPEDPFIQMFSSYAELQKFAADSGDREWTLRCILVDELGKKLPEKLAAVERNHVSALKDARLVLTTTHKAKGLEYDHVMLSDDFIEIENKALWKESVEVDEANILYVAASRAKKTLAVPEKYLPHYHKIKELKTANVTKERREMLSRGVHLEIINNIERKLLNDIAKPVKPATAPDPFDDENVKKEAPVRRRL